MKDQIAVITGGAQGIGFEVARQLVERGVRVASWDLDPANGEAMATLCGDSLAVSCDVSDPSQIEAAMDQTVSRLGVPDIAVSSAGITGPNSTLEDYDIAAWKKVFDVNVHGTFMFNRACVHGMKAKGYGRILNIASVAGKEGNPNASAYSASKAAVIGLTKSLGKELAGHDIAVNCVTPAAAKTRIFDQMSDEHINYMLSKIPRGRFLSVEEAANMIVWAVSPENSFTTGAVFDLSGGRATY